MTGPTGPPAGPPPSLERPSADELGTTLRNLVSEVTRLRADLDELRDRSAGGPIDLDALVSRLLVELVPVLTARERPNPAGSAGLPFRAAPPSASPDTPARTDSWQDRTA